MASNVQFYFGAQAKYDALTEKQPLALYFIEDTKRLYKGDVLIATGAEATAQAAGLMSAADKQALDELIASGGLDGLAPLDGSISIADGDDGGKTIGVAISAEAGNIITKKADGLYVDASGSVDVPEYSIEKQDDAGTNAVAVYKLKKTVGTESSYVGDEISIPKDLVISSGSLEIVAEADVPYTGAAIGDPYLDIVLSNADSDHIYIPVKGLVDTYAAGDGIKIENNIVSVNLGSTTNGLHFVDGTLNLALATADTAGALSAVDKAFIDSIATTYATKAELDAVKDQITWTEL